MAGDIWRIAYNREVGVRLSAEREVRRLTAALAASEAREAKLRAALTVTVDFVHNAGKPSTILACRGCGKEVGQTHYDSCWVAPLLREHGAVTAEGEE